ncbi:MAG: hypothetical protein MT490_12625 [Sphingomonas sp.]|uniref:hypothetical protein n=1 Tax=Sphingomonas sp. TaxID=28214 RepID=UPI002272BA5C|nr:hypothetical protein [Sphingomonas sp.]MCX8476635.1 hypothetical protein [Sphingomonas sp.]
MSHDQRPGRMRVVQDPADFQRRRGDATTIEGTANTVAIDGSARPLAGVATAASTSAAAAVVEDKRLPLLPAGLFLLACAAGGVLVAVVRPLGLG